MSTALDGALPAVGPEARAPGSRPAIGVRWRVVLGAGAIGTAILFGLLVLPEVYRTLPRQVRRSCEAGAAAALVALLTLRPGQLAGHRIGPEAWERLDTLARWALDRGLSAVALGASLVLLAGWVPHYLTWPMWSDSDQFAVAARAWDDGLRPYRDLPDFDFPGPIYLFWTFGRLFGWGGTAPLYAFDAACLGLLGLALGGWSRRRFGRALPGLVGYLVFLSCYLELTYLRVAQRDWQATLAAALGLMALEAWPGRVGRIASAAALGLALAFRPQPAVFLPAFAAAVAANARRPEGARESTGRALAEWSALLALAGLLAFGPLLLAGVMGDFLRVLRVAWYGGPYNRMTPGRFGIVLIGQLQDWRGVGLFAALLLLAVRAREPIRGPARTWGLALVGALAYKPISPVPHSYLDVPLFLIEAIGAAVLAAWIADGRFLVLPVRTLAVCALLAVGVHARPQMFNPRASARAVADWIRGEAPGRPPPGCLCTFERPCIYRWQDYQAVLAYLRRSTAPDTPVANFLRRYPYPTLNGPAGRPSPFPAANGILYLWWVDSTLEPRFIRGLEASAGVVVVWVPGEEPGAPALRLERMEATIRRLYRPVARFGQIEVWRRSDEEGRQVAGLTR
ncbi:MAG TPA: hypothetical protein VFF52_14990 [Isosphaeraceae bacterium]|nr:hypothetical protein [Isosphaeraceae bacterium]